MADRTCSEDGCDRPVRCSGRCAGHYARWIRTVPTEDRRRPTIAARFASMVSMADNGCHIWTGARDDRQYGRFGARKHGTVLAHRYALEQHLGRPLRAGYQACHTCDNPPCVNPGHLYEGTNQQNVDDMTRQSRQAWGERNGQRKLTLDQVRSVPALIASGRSQRSIAEEFGVSRSQISKIAGGKRWTLAGSA